ncbi:sugar phosphate nucleotidyltransferase [Halorussus gelatinilyticus]|uniref:Sugar phosphate nucleotidyltransferase n=1 Tax=Halorussus gelatinilyticus TaxID=2937524 RepID=A0A8U0IMS9_9EURY|nr:sugar phosphate nucleotidyltransferase [Halorussus gelatinilyticus]UPW01935.1 sugar phosphate nucleotidyltransferase [Halorussus gelatinilyticus]
MSDADSTDAGDALERPVVALVMAGGTGTRLYPASRSDRPKQFLSLGGATGGDSLLARTVSRVRFADEIYVSTGEDHAETVREEVPEAGVLVEPEAKDTGPALAYAAHRIREQVGECVLLCVPSDHLVAGDFAPSATRAARTAVETEGLVAFGVEPTRPATGYGYIEPSDSETEHTGIEQFREKPDRETAERFVEDGFYWNAGLFAWTPESLLREARDSPLGPLVEALEAGDPERGFAEVESVSIDYAVMERTDDAYVVPADFEWDDVGAWDAIERVVETDGDGNAVLGDGLTIDAMENVVAADDRTHVSLVGVEGLVVAAYGDRVLVVPKDEAQRVREVVAELREQGRF